MASAAEPVNWKRNLFVAWVGCFLTGAAFSLVMPFLPLYVETLGVTGHQALNIWSGLLFSITFLFSAIAAPFWGALADRRGRKLMLLRAVLGLLGGFIPNANALIATQVPRNRSGWALGTLSTGGVGGALVGPLIGGLLADLYGLRPVFYITAAVLFVCFVLTLLYVKEQFTPVQKRDMLHAKQVFASLKNPKLVLSLFVTTMIIQIATGSIAPILTLYVRDLAGATHNLAFISGLIASVPGVAALMSAPRLGKLGDRIGPERILVFMLIVSVLLLIPMAFVQTPWQLGVLRFLLGAADGALLPAVQTLLIYNCTNQVAGRIFSYNQSFRDVGNVSGPLLGAAVSAGYGFRAVFAVTALVVLFNAGYSWWCLRRRPGYMREETLQEEQ
ncbi:TPA: MFS transporter [Serratia marcescens]